MRYHNCHFVCVNSYTASVTVDDITIQGRANSIHSAKEKAANRMIAYLILNHDGANDTTTAENTEKLFPSDTNNADNVSKPVSSMSSLEVDDSEWSREQRDLQRM